MNLEAWIFPLAFLRQQYLQKKKQGRIFTPNLIIVANALSYKVI